MEIRVENADTPQMKNCYIDTEIFSISGFYGLSDIEIQHTVNGDSSRLWLNREEFNELYDMMTEMKKQMKNWFYVFWNKRFSLWGNLRIRDAGGHTVDYSDYNMRYNDNVKEYILAVASDYLDSIYKDLDRPQIDSPV